MKLDQKNLFVVLVAVFAMGCGSRASTQAVSAPRNPVAMTRIMAAELTDSDDAPRVGKSHRSEEAIADDEGAKDAPRHGRSGGGFSGYK